METRQIQIRFTEKTEMGEYSDALYYSYDMYITGDIKEEDIEKEKATRVANWIEMIKNPPVVPKPTPEDIQIQIDSVESMVESFELQKSELILRKAELIKPTPEEIQAQIDELAFKEISIASQKAELASLKIVRTEEIAVAEALALEEKLLDEKPVEEEPIGEVRK